MTQSGHWAVSQLPGFDRIEYRREPAVGNDMQRRSGSGQPTKRQRTSRPKARKAPIAQVSTADLQQQVAALTRELKDAREHQTADDLEHISSNRALPPIATAKADARKRSCPLYPHKRTCAVQTRMSALGQKRT